MDAFILKGNVVIGIIKARTKDVAEKFFNEKYLKNHSKSKYKLIYDKLDNYRFAELSNFKQHDLEVVNEWLLEIKNR